MARISRDIAHLIFLTLKGNVDTFQKCIKTHNLLKLRYRYAVRVSRTPVH